MIKKIRFPFFSLLFLMFHVFNIEAQKTDPFKELNKKYIETGFLYDKVKLPVSKIKSFPAKNDNFTEKPAQWREILNEIKQASLNTVKIPDAVNLKKNVKNKLRKNIFPVGIINFQYNGFKKEAIESGKVKLEKNKIVITDKNAVYKKSVFTVSLADAKKYTGKKVVFDFSEKYYFSNRKSNPEYMLVDFDDGKGLKKVMPGDFVKIKYDSDGKKKIKIKLFLKSGEYFTSGFIFYVNTPKMPTPSETWTNYTADISYLGTAAQGEVGIFFGNGNTDFTRPVIIVDGFDPGDTRDLAGLWDIANQQNMVDNLLAEGYDFVITNFYGGDDYIQRNAMLVVKLIQDINARMTAAGTMKPANQIVVIGPSMGGLITRYAIRYMEQNNIPHNVRNWISFDSPQKGADIPLGLQHWVRFFAQEAGNASAQEALASLSGPAAKQMLIYHYSATSGNTANSNGLFSSFYNEINAMGFPEQTRIVSIINGSGYGNGQPYNPGDQVIYYSYRSWLVDLDGNVWAVPNQTNTRIFNGLYDTALPFDEVNENIYVNNTLPYDGAPGGSRATFAEMDAIDPGYGDIVAPWPNHAFIPTISALCLQNTVDPYYNVDANSADITTPFDKLYYPSENQEHVEITPESYNWFYHEVINFVPQFTSIPVTSIDEDTQYQYTLTATDENEWNVLTYELIEKPDWLNFDATTGIFNGTPVNEDVGTHNVSVKVSDGLDESIQTFTITVNNTNDAPVFTSVPPETVYEDSLYSYTLSATDEDPTNDILTFSTVDIPGWMSFDKNTAILSGTPLNENIGAHNVTIKVNDGTVDVFQTFTITVNNTNDAPVFTSVPPETVYEDSLYSYTLSATDEDPTNDILTFSTVDIPDWLSFDENTATLSGIPLNEDVGENNITLKVNDGTVDVFQTFTITVNNTNDAPVFTSVPPETVYEDSLYSYTLSATDEDPTNDILTFSTVNIPGWMSFDKNTAILSGTPLNENIGAHNVTIKVNDGTVDVFQTFTITVNNTNDAPVFTSVPPETVYEDSLYSYTLSATDEDPTNDVLTFSSVEIPSWLSFDASTGTLSGKPLNEDVGTHNVTLRVNDGTEDVEQTFIITVQNTNDAPFYEGCLEDKETLTGIEFLYILGENCFTDIDEGDNLHYSAKSEDGSDLPSWLNFNSDTKTFEGIPYDTQILNVKVTAADDSGSVASGNFIITVNENNTAETAGEDDFGISPNPASDFINFDLPYNKDPYIFNLYDVNGKLIFSEKIYPKEENRINISKLSRGYYIAKLVIANRIILKKLMIQ